MNNSKSTHLVAALVYDRLGTFEFGCITEVFALPRPEMGAGWYRFVACAIEPGALRAMGGLRFEAPHGLDILDQADTIIIPGWRDPDEIPPAPLLDKLRQALARGARLCSICSGAFVLAWAGLLDGKPATTHWRLASRMQRHFPSVRLRTESLYVDAGQILTSAGSAAGLDMMLHLVARDHGSKAANLVAQRLIMPPHRNGDQAQFITRPVLPDDMGRLSHLIDWLRNHLAEPHSLESMARQASMSTRTLQRQFVEATSLSPVEWLVHERVAMAKQLLEAPRPAITVIGERTGFGSDESFRRHFRRVTGVSPHHYRKAFGLTQEGIPAAY